MSANASRVTYEHAQCVIQLCPPIRHFDRREDPGDEVVLRSKIFKMADGSRLYQHGLGK